MSSYLCLAAIAIMGILMQLFFSQQEYYRNDKHAIVLKASCSFVTVLLCLYALIEKHAPIQSWFLFIGLFLCMIADGVIELRFETGVLIFLVANLCFTAYYFTLAPFNGFSLIIFAVGLIFAAILFRRRWSKLGKHFIIYAAHAAVLALMFSIAVTLPFQVEKTGATCIAVGAASLLASNLLLSWYRSDPVSLVRRRLVLYFYYPAVYLLAVSEFYL